MATRTIGWHGIRALRELGRSYLALTKDSTRVMNRIKSVFRSWAIPCAGTSVYSRRHRAQWLAQLGEPGVRIRAEHLYQELDSLQPLRIAQLLGHTTNTQILPSYVKPLDANTRAVIDALDTARTLQSHIPPS